MFETWPQSGFNKNRESEEKVNTINMQMSLSSMWNMYYIQCFVLYNYSLFKIKISVWGIWTKLNIWPKIKYSNYKAQHILEFCIEQFCRFRELGHLYAYGVEFLFKVSVNNRPRFWLPFTFFPIFSWDFFFVWLYFSALNARSEIWVFTRL